MSELREAAQRLLDACLAADADEELSHHVDGTLLDAVSAALSAEPAQEMTDEQIEVCLRESFDGTPSTRFAIKFARAVIAADRASRLPEMGEGDWPELPKPAKSIPLGHFGVSFGPDGVKKTYDCTYSEDWYSAEQFREGQRAAVEKYKALVRGKA
jgi:hypothetical protein